MSLCHKPSKRQLFYNGTIVYDGPDIKNKEKSVNIKRLVSPIVIDGKISDALLTLKESVDKNDGSRIYSLELDNIVERENSRGGVHADPGAQSGITHPMHWEYLPEGLSNLQRIHEKIKRFLKKAEDVEYRRPFAGSAEADARHCRATKRFFDGLWHKQVENLGGI